MPKLHRSLPLKFSDLLRYAIAALVTDLEMSDLHGLELTRRLRSMPQWDALPIVMITSRATEKHRDMAGKAGVDLYLSKPYVDIDFLAHLRRFTTSESKVEAARFG